MKTEWSSPDRSPFMGIFPFGGKVIETLLDIQTSWDKYLKIKIPSLYASNPNFSRYLFGQDNPAADPGYVKGFRVGLVLAHEAAREKAWDKQLPVISEGFMQNYLCLSWCRFDNYWALADNQTRTLAVNKENEIRKGLFMMFEPEAFRVLEDELIDGDPDQVLYDHPVFDGFTYGHFLLRAALSDRHNWITH